MRRLLIKQSQGKATTAAATAANTKLGKVTTVTAASSKPAIEGGFRFFKLTMTSHEFTGTENEQGKHVAIRHLEFYEFEAGS